MSNMTTDIAARLVGMLVVTTTGWTDTTTDATVDLIIQRWPSAEAGHIAVNQTIESWDRQGRPPWAVLNNAYRDAVRRIAMTAPALDTADARAFTSVSTGRKLAARAYAAECARRDPETDVLILSGFRSNEPNPDRLDWLLGIGKNES
tara:strand:- start:464 stop:907 length:444 start_codon:yes stop_codon:yes gene_type:complete